MIISPLIKKVQIFNNPELDLICCVATSHSKTGLSSIGGTRFADYVSLDEAVNDAMNLAEAMNLKCAVAKLPYVGGKSVILKSKNSTDKKNFFSGYGKVIQSLQGELITGCDVGVNNDDMEITKLYCDFITGLSYDTNVDYLTYLTAVGVFESMRICLDRIKGSNSLTNIHVAIQGVGKVGAYLVELLREAGAILTITDTNKEAIKKIASYSIGNVVEEKDIFGVECDIFSPCAMGGAINLDTVNQLKCSIICGAANNQLSDVIMLENLSQRSIFFMPDWICNVGGAIYASESYSKTPINEIDSKVKKIISSRSLELLDFVEKHQLPKGCETFISNLNIHNR